MPRTKEAFEAMRETTRQKVEAAALYLFARKGISVTIGDIAQTAKISKGLLYSHYPSKDALIAELVRQATTISSENTVLMTQGDAPAVDKIKKITEMMCGMFSVAHIGIDYFMFMVQVGMSDFNVPEASWYSAEYPNPAEIFTELIIRGQAEGSVVGGDAIQLSHTYWSAVQGMCCYAITNTVLTPEPIYLNRIIIKENFL